MQGCGVSEIGVRGVTETKGSQKVHQECTFYKTDTLSSAATADVVKCLPEKMATIVAGWRDWLRGGLSAVSGGDKKPDDHAAEVEGVLSKWPGSLLRAREHCWRKPDRRLRRGG